MGLLDRIERYKNGEFAPRALTYSNVQALFNRCLASEETKAESIMNTKEYSLDRDKILKNRRDIQFYLGQLKLVHDKKRKYTDLEDLLYKYDGSIWAQSVDDVMKFVYLLGGSELINNEHTLFDDGPTLSPADPNFESWWEPNKEAWELLTYNRIESWINDIKNMPLNDFSILDEHDNASTFDQMQRLSEASDRMLKEKLERLGL